MEQPLISTIGWPWRSPLANVLYSGPAMSLWTPLDHQTFSRMWQQKSFPANPEGSSPLSFFAIFPISCLISFIASNKGLHNTYPRWLSASKSTQGASIHALCQNNNIVTLPTCDVLLCHFRKMSFTVGSYSYLLYTLGIGSLINDFCQFINQWFFGNGWNVDKRNCHTE